MVVFKGDLEFSFVLASPFLQRVDIDVVFWHALKLFASKPKPALLLVEVLLAQDAELAEALLDLLEAVSLLSRRQKQAIADVCSPLFLENMERLFIQVLGVPCGIRCFH